MDNPDDYDLYLQEIMQDEEARYYEEMLMYQGKMEKIADEAVKIFNDYPYMAYREVIERAKELIEDESLDKVEKTS